MAPQSKQLYAALARRNRKLSDISIVASPYPKKTDLEMVRQYKDLGVTELVPLVYPYAPEALDSVLRDLAREYMDPVSPGAARLN